MKFKNIIIFTILNILITAQSVYAVNEIDRIELQCINNTSKYSTMMLCTQNAQIAWEKEINTYMELLKRDLIGSDLKTLLSSQNKWENYRNNEFKLIDKVLKKKTNLMNKNIACGLKKDLTKQRAIYLKDYYELLNEN